MPSSERQWDSKRRVFLFFQARKRTEICLFPCYFVRGAFIKTTNIDFGKAMKRVMTLRPSAALVRARARGDDQSTRAEIGDFNYLTLPAKFTICRTTSCCLSCTHIKIRAFVYFQEKTSLTFPLLAHLAGSVSFNLLIFIFLR